MRSPEDLCLLCNEQKATKKESHLIPTFLSKGIFEVERIVYEAKPTETHKPPKMMQTGWKEDYLFCPDCESYFSVIESEFASKIFNRINKPEFRNEFPIEYLRGRKIKACIQVHQHIFPLLIASIFYRLHVSSRKYPVATNEIRKFLLRYRSVKLRELNAKLNINYDASFLFRTNAITYEGNVIDKQRMMYIYDVKKPFSKRNPQFIMIDRFVFSICFDVLAPQTDVGINNAPNKLPYKVIIEDSTNWNKNLRRYHNQFRKEAFDFLNSTGNAPFIPKKKKVNLLDRSLIKNPTLN